MTTNSPPSSDYYYEDDDPEFLAALATAVLPGDLPIPALPPPPPPSPPPPAPVLDVYGPSRYGHIDEYKARKRAKLQIQNGQDERKSGIFSGVAIYITGRTEPSLQDLRHLILHHGGTFHAYLDRKSLVTHIVASTLTPAKTKEFRSMKAVLPSWLVESAKLGRLLPWHQFKLGSQPSSSTLSTFVARQPSPEHVSDSEVEREVDSDNVLNEIKALVSRPRLSRKRKRDEQEVFMHCTLDHAQLHHSIPFYTILVSHADHIQIVSVHESILTLHSPQHAAKPLAEKIQAQVKLETGCTMTIGISSHSPFFAHLALRRAKASSCSLYHHLSKPTIHQTKKEEEDVCCEMSNVQFDSHSQLYSFLSDLVVQVQRKTKRITHICLSITTTTGKVDKQAQVDNLSEMEKVVFKLWKESTLQPGDIRAIGIQTTRTTSPSSNNTVQTLQPIASSSKLPPPPPVLSQPTEPTDLRSLSPVDMSVFNRLPEDVGQETAAQTLQPSPSPTRILSPPVPSTTARRAFMKQPVLPFKRTLKPKARKHSPPIQPVASSSKMPPPPQPVPMTDLPSFSQVDMSVFNELPDDVRQELEIEYTKRRTVPHIPPPAALRIEPAVPPAPSTRHSTPTKNKTSHFKGIAKQFATSSSTYISQSQSLFGKKTGKWATSSSSIRISDNELSRLHIDIDVFRSLPISLQREQLSLARFVKERGLEALNAFTDVRKVKVKLTRREVWIKRRLDRLNGLTVNRAGAKGKGKKGGGAGVKRRPNPRAVYPFNIPSLKRPAPDPRLPKLSFTSTQDVQNVLTQWVNGFKRSIPDARDVNIFSNFLVESMDGERVTDEGMEKAIGVLKWWLALLRRHWSLFEHEPDLTLNSSTIDSGIQKYRTGRDGKKVLTTEFIAKSWWAAFRQVKARMDDVVRARFGGKLSLR